MDTEHLLDEDLPPSVLHLKELLGINAALKLVETFGGTHIRVPPHYDPNHLITRILGHEKAALFMQTYAREMLYIAKADVVLRVQRNILIAQKHDGGVPASALALEFGLTERHIWNILKRPETLRSDGPEQPSLF